MKRKGCMLAAVLLALVAFLPRHAVAQAAQATDSWQFSAILYGYFPTVGGKTTFPVSVGSGLAIDPGTILDHSITRPGNLPS